MVRQCASVLVKNFISVDENRFVSFLLKVNISLPCKRMGTASALYSVRSGNNISAMSCRPQFVRTYVVWTLYLKRIGTTNVRNTMGRHCRNVFVWYSLLRMHVKFCVNTSLSWPPVKWVPGLSRGFSAARGVLLTTHPLLVPRSWKSRAIPLPTLWATPGL